MIRPEALTDDEMNCQLMLIERALAKNGCPFQAATFLLTIQLNHLSCLAEEYRSFAEADHSSAAEDHFSAEDRFSAVDRSVAAVRTLANRHDAKADRNAVPAAPASALA